MNFATAQTMRWEDGTPVEYVVPPVPEEVAEAVQSVLESFGLQMMIAYDIAEDGTDTPRNPPYACLVKLHPGQASEEER